jgi:hypothetical protein
MRIRALPKPGNPTHMQVTVNGNTSGRRIDAKRFELTRSLSGFQYVEESGPRLRDVIVVQMITQMIMVRQQHSLHPRLDTTYQKVWTDNIREVLDVEKATGSSKCQLLHAETLFSSMRPQVDPEEIYHVHLRSRGRHRDELFRTVRQEVGGTYMPRHCV